MEETERFFEYYVFGESELVGFVYVGKNLDALEAIVRARSDESLTMRFLIPLDLKASVVRDVDTPNVTDEETVVLVSGEHVQRVSRHKGNNGGELSVSCSPKGKEVLIQSINIQFRPYEDLLTDRGTIWIFPGNPTRAEMTIKASALRISSESLRAIIEAARAAAGDKLLKYFPATTNTISIQ